MQSFFSSLELPGYLKVLMALSLALSLRAMTGIRPLTLLHLPFHRLLVKLAAEIPAAISLAFAARTGSLVVNDTNNAVLTRRRSPRAEQPPFEQSLS